jgi:hypothetical protein
MSKVNNIEVYDGYIKIFFFNKDHGFTIIDKEDYFKVKDYCWYRVPTTSKKLFYAVARTKGNFNKTRIKMHQVIHTVEKGFIPEHRDGDGLNNRKINLRSATNGQNQMNKEIQSNNTSKHVGVSWHKLTKKWRAYINKDDKRKELGLFAHKEDAIKARQNAEEELHNEFSYKKSRGETRICQQ